MGRQVGFFWHGADGVGFRASLRQTSDVRILRYTSTTEIFESLVDLPPCSEPAWSLVWWWNPTRCAPPTVGWIERQRYYTIDRFALEVIELSRPYERDGALVGGRLWAEFAGWRRDTPGHTFEKSEAFLKWSQSMVGWMAKHYARLPNGDLIAPGAQEYCRSGGRLMGADFASVVKGVHHGLE